MTPLGLVLSLAIGVTLGLLGGGGSILTTPVLIYALGVDTKEAIATSLVVVGATSLAGLVPHARAGNVAWRTGFVFGAAGMVGSYLGGIAAAWVPDRVLLGLFGLMMLATALATFRGRAAPVPHHVHPTWQVIAEGLVVGVVTGLVGAGGGFLVVPALTLLGGLSMHRAVGTALLVIAMKSFAGYLGHATHVSVDWGLTAQVTLAAIAGSVLGGALVSRVRPEHLRRGFAVFVLSMSVFVIFQQLRGPLAP